MIWTFVGERKDTRKDEDKLLSILQKKQPDAEVIRMDEDAFDPTFLDEIISSQGLFSPKYIVVVEQTDMKGAGEVLFGKLKEMKEAEHAFIISAAKVLTEAKKKLQKYSFEYKEHSQPSPKGFGMTQKQNAFEMADKIGERDVIGLWYLLVQKLTDDVSPEEIHGMFVWQVKGVLLALKTKSAAEANMNDYPYTKAKRYAKNYSEAELEDLLFSLVYMYDQAHSGKANLKIELERWVLGLK